MRFITLLAIAVLLTFAPLTAGAEDYSWRRPHARVIETGDLEWAPEPFEFEAGETVRYIDYENGDDANDGLTKETPWKHHPWDTRAEASAADASGVATYVFKRGVHYRLHSPNGEEALLRADESGEPGNPIRLTSDPDWGGGEAVIAGSRPLAQTWKVATAADVPERMDVTDQTVWYVDLKLPHRPDGKGGRMGEPVLYVVRDSGEIYDLHVASDVGWSMTNPSFAMHHWNTWDEYRPRGKGGGPYQDDALKGRPADYFEGGTVWSQYAWVIANPTPDGKPIGPGDYDPEEGTLRYKKGNDPVNPGTRYLVENLPQFLDRPGEFYYDRERGRLFVRLQEDHDPNAVRIELATAYDTVRITSRSHIEISGLAFRFNGRNPFPASSHVILLDGNCAHIAIENCTFEHIANDAISAVVEADEEMDYIRVTDCDFNCINGGTAIRISGDSGGLKVGQVLGRLGHAQVLRNRTRNTGLYRHDDHRWSNVPAITCQFARLAEVAGNVVDSAWGSGIVVQGGKTGKDDRGWDIPLTRIFVHHNKAEYTALGVNDYGGFSIWQHGPIYVYSNVAGNAVGHWPGGFYNNRTVNLSYPLYLDAAFKVHNFNNVIWGRRRDPEDPYSSTSSAFFNVFGYMNPFVNNTVVGCAIGLGGTSGNRNEYLGNVFTEIGGKFISVNHGGNPSLIGGDDPGTSGIDGASTLAYGHNVFHGPATAGVVATVERGAKKDLRADEIDVLAQQLREYPVRFGQLGTQVGELPIAEPLPWSEDKPSASDADFRPADNVRNRGVKYFVPWSLYGTVGEWHFNENHWNPSVVLDFHHYPTDAYFHRSMYYKVPVFELEVNEAELADYVESPSEDWARGALSFDGSRHACVPHQKMAADVLININNWRRGRKWRLPPAPWTAPEPEGEDAGGNATYRDEQFLRFPGSERKTLDMGTNNVLVEVNLRTAPGHTGGGILGKHDGDSGYRLFVNASGQAEFEVSSGGEHGSVATRTPINDGAWHHVLAEVDRATGRMTVYLDGTESNRGTASMSVDDSLANTADYLVGRDDAGDAYLRGAIDFMRVCRGTLADAETDIVELYEWQMNGPVKHDFAGNDPAGSGRDAGALERTQ